MPSSHCWQLQTAKARFSELFHVPDLKVPNT